MLNRIDLAGRLVRDPEMRRTASGVSLCNFTLAVDRDFKSQDGNKETDFIDCVAWRQSADFAGKYLTKGSIAVVSGRLQIDSYTDKDGNKRKSTKVNCDNVYSCGNSRQEATPAERETYTAPYPGAAAGYGGYPAAGGYIPPATPDEYALLDDDNDGQLLF